MHVLLRVKYFKTVYVQSVSDFNFSVIQFTIYYLYTPEHVFIRSVWVSRDECHGHKRGVLPGYKLYIRCTGCKFDEYYYCVVKQMFITESQGPA